MTTSTSLLRSSLRLRSSQLSRFYSSTSPSSKEKTTTTAKTPKFDGFVTVYKFPYLAPAVLFTKFKIVQTAAVTLVLAPYYVYQGAIGAEHPNTVATVLGLASFATVSMLGMGEVARRIVGIVYYNKETDEVRISHVTFWGRRADKLFHREDILTLSEVNEDTNKFLWRVHFQDSNQKPLFMSTRKGGVLHQVFFRRIFTGFDE